MGSIKEKVGEYQNRSKEDPKNTWSSTLGKINISRNIIKNEYKPWELYKDEQGKYIMYNNEQSYKDYIADLTINSGKHALAMEQSTKKQ